MNKIIHNPKTGKILGVGSAIPEDENQKLLDIPENFDLKSIYNHRVVKGVLSQKTNTQKEKLRVDRDKVRKGSLKLTSDDLLWKLINDEPITEEEKQTFNKLYTDSVGE